MRIKFYRTDGQHLGDHLLPPGFSYSVGPLHRMPPDAPEAARKYQLFRVVEGVQDEEMGEFLIPTFRAIVVES
jgi:hypothetical protein